MLALAEQMPVEVEITEGGNYIELIQYDAGGEEVNTIYVHVNNINLLISAIEEVAKSNEQKV